MRMPVKHSTGMMVPILLLKQKSLGQAIMVSDFIEEVDGLLKFSNLEASELLEHQKDGYFDNNKFLNQVLKAVNIFNAKYPNAQGLLIFDNATSHCKLLNDALNVSKMNVGSGGRQPAMRNTYFHGKQQMTLQNGQPKGMRMVLEERGIRTDGINASRMREELLKSDDFKGPSPIVKGKIQSMGHLCFFLENSIVNKTLSRESGAMPKNTAMDIAMAQ